MELMSPFWYGLISVSLELQRIGPIFSLAIETISSWLVRGLTDIDFRGTADISRKPFFVSAGRLGAPIQLEMPSSSTTTFPHSTLLTQS